jgi:PIN domain nuclease of toxin-antitoxin system
MRLLLDTHVVLVLLDGRVGALGREIAAVFEAGGRACHVSVATLWEIAIKWRLGKLSLGLPPQHLPELLDEMGLSTLPVTAAHVLAAIEPEPATRDPFDRLLLGVCEAEGLRLVTVDRALVGHPLALKMR